MMTEEVWNDLHQCMDTYSNAPTPSNRFDINHNYHLWFEVDPYPSFYESLVQQAVQYKRAGNYGEAIKCYIEIFDDAECFNTEIVRYLCKVLICDGELTLAFNLLSAAYLVLKAKCGPFPNPNIPSIPWAQYNDLLQLGDACYEFARTRNSSPFCAYVAKIAGNPSYRPNVSDLVLLTQVYIIIRTISRRL